ncbi:MAG: sigma-70 family RNA polymerase sigma factor [Prevotella sp.]|nr:sigma-70 family RNA polymerase sigma factor [Prevotella sp.]
MNLDDLIQRAKEKDPNAFDIIYRTYYPKMVGVCMNIIREDKATVDDLVHDAFIMAFVSIGSLRNNNRFSEWLTTIVRNVSLKHVEQRDKVRIQSISSMSDDDVAFIDSSSSPESELNHKELLRLISLLPEGYSKILRLSVIEGFSHKEIADMLGIEPHSSSSQLSRAKRYLKRMIDNRMVGVFALLLLSLALYFSFHHGGKQQDEDAIVETKQQPSKSDLEKTLTEQRIDSKESVVKKRVVPATERIPMDILTENVVLLPDTDNVSVSDTVSVNPLPDISDDMLITEVVEDSLDEIFRDSVVREIIQPEINIAEESGKKTNKWQILAAGSLGPALAQNAYKLLAIDNSLLPEPEASSVLPDYVKTWEDYGKYLRAIPIPSVSADTLALIEIADHNTGEIEQVEHHDKPITFGLSLTKSLGGKWAIGTGVQYSMLRSQFAMGENGYSVVDEQKVHYLGIPLSVSYNWIDYRYLSAYSSFGATIHIPVYGKTKTNYLVDWKSAYSVTNHFTPSLQWQTGISLGLQYKFAPYFSIFVEPTFNWFIPSGGDTHTIWTEHPFMFTCPFGIRIAW